jgi:hypothetical protein
MARVKKLTDSTYSPTIAASEEAIRTQIDDSIQEAHDLALEDVTTNRKLSPTGDFTGTINGGDVTLTEPGLSGAFNAHLAETTRHREIFVSEVEPESSVGDDGAVHLQLYAEGEPDYSIVEMGSNANGNYILYANGFLECFSSFAIDPTSSETQLFDLPHVFTQVLNVQVTGRTTTGSSAANIKAISTAGGFATTTQYAIKLGEPSVVAGAYPISILARGWYLP